jgi:hypothetical protein
LNLLSKNPITARFFVNIGYADELGSGMRNLYRYTRIYTNGAEPELIEGDIFRTIIPLVADNPVKIDDSLTDIGKAFFSLYCLILPSMNGLMTQWQENTPPHLRPRSDAI